MSTVLRRKPFSVSFKVNQRKRSVSPYNKPTRVKIPTCDWPKVVKAMEQVYPDMIIENAEQNGDMITFDARFTNRPTTEADLRWRLYNFLDYTPAMRVREIRFNRE